MVSIYTIGEMCKKCYSCVRVCPTKAIEVHGGQANIIEERCISCGHCVPRCSQGAKRVRSSVAEVRELLAGPRPVRVMLAPSFPAAFLDAEPERLVGALAQCGFAAVHEVAFGADLVSWAYHRLYGSARAGRSFVISSPCPAVVSFVEKMHPNLVPHLAPVKSPMEAMATVIRERLDPAAAIVFVGPCVAKKDEARRSDLVDQVLTYAELPELFGELGVEYRRSPEREFDPPLANLGKIYPVTGGLLKAAAIDADILESPVCVVEGSSRVSDILEVLSSRVERGDEGGSDLFDLLFCEGCIAGPIMPNELTFYERKKFIIDYMKRRPLVADIDVWAEDHREYLDLDLGKSFRAAKAGELAVPPEEIAKILALTGKFKKEDELNCRACGYDSCRDKAIAVYRGIAEVEMCLPYLISKLEVAIRDLTDNQQRLIQAEKLASMGQMAAGIAHEINNPLGVVLMYAHLLKEELDGSAAPAAPAPSAAPATAPGSAPATAPGAASAAPAPAAGGTAAGAAGEPAAAVKPASAGQPAPLGTSAAPEAPADVDRIIREAERARQIVRGILNFARKEQLNRESAEVNALLEQSVEAYRGRSPGLGLDFQADPDVGKREIDAAQMRQVFDNIIANAVEACAGSGSVQVRSEAEPGGFRVTVSDTGPGIPDEALPKLFTPFFTTKPPGKGTGLGLAVCYGIVKMHGGSIQARNRPGGGAVFDIRIRDPEAGSAEETRVQPSAAEAVS